MVVYCIRCQVREAANEDELYAVAAASGMTWFGPASSASAVSFLRCLISFFALLSFLRIIFRTRSLFFALIVALRATRDSPFTIRRVD